MICDLERANYVVLNHRTGEGVLDPQGRIDDGELRLGGVLICQIRTLPGRYGPSQPG
jgi:hypothetical protein